MIQKMSDEYISNDNYNDGYDLNYVSVTKKEEDKNRYYSERFKRNLGVLTANQQDNIKKIKILIIGVGGIGSYAAELFVRCGVENITIVDFDSYELSNTNRQIYCNVSTLGQSKAKVVEKHLKEINPRINCTSILSILSLNEARELIRKSDFVFPAADDFAYSLELFRISKELRKSALLVVPSGFWGITTIQTPTGKSVLDLFGVPKKSDSEYIKNAFSPSSYRIRGFFYKKMAGYTNQYFNDFVEGKVQPSQICPVVWSITSIGVLESIKFITKKYEFVSLPFFYEISKNKIKKRFFYGLRGFQLRIAGWIASIITVKNMKKN